MVWSLIMSEIIPFLRIPLNKGGKTKSTRLVESEEVAKSLCYSRMMAIFSS